MLHFSNLFWDSPKKKNPKERKDPFHTSHPSDWRQLIIIGIVLMRSPEEKRKREEDWERHKLERLSTVGHIDSTKDYRETRHVGEQNKLVPRSPCRTLVGLKLLLYFILCPKETPVPGSVPAPDSVPVPATDSPLPLFCPSLPTVSLCTHIPLPLSYSSCFPLWA